MAKQIILIICLISFLAVGAYGQMSHGYGQYREYDNRSVFVLAGYARGPHFPKFIDWANNFYADHYGSTDKISDFSGGLNFAAGLRNRFSSNFAIEFDFAVHSTTTKRQFNGFDGAIPFSQSQYLDLNVAQITVSPMIVFDFSKKQLIVPFVSAGVSIFSMRLDHAIDYYVRHTKVALASNFSIGIETRLTGRLWGDIRGDWTIGSTQMPVSQINGQPESFNMSLNTAQIHFGILYALD
jgi:hypothetical protein